MDHHILHNLSYGMYIVSSRNGNKYNAQTANSVFQVTSQPATIAASINKQNLTHQYITASKYFTVSILAEDTPVDFIAKFGFRSGHNSNKFENINYKVLESGVPVVLDNSLGYLEVKVTNEIDCGTHTIFFGKVLSSELSKEARPMTYDYYHQVKKGATPKTAPTYIEGDK